jgi:hypothetical protein
MLGMQHSKPSIGCTVTLTLVTLTQGRQALTSRHSATKQDCSEPDAHQQMHAAHLCLCLCTAIPQAALTVSLPKAASVKFKGHLPGT